MSDSALAIYLNDHLALMTGEIELVRRVAKENADNPLAGFLSPYEAELSHQKQLLADAVKLAGGTTSSVKQAAGWVAEKAGRFKLNDSLTEYTDLARLLETEALLAAAFARTLLWKTLAEIPMPKIQGYHREHTAAMEAAQRQLAGLEAQHQRAKELVFGQ